MIVRTQNQSQETGGNTAENTVIIHHPYFQGQSITRPKLGMRTLLSGGMRMGQVGEDAGQGLVGLEEQRREESIRLKVAEVRPEVGSPERTDHDDAEDEGGHQARIDPPEPFPREIGQASTLQPASGNQEATNHEEPVDRKAAWAQEPDSRSTVSSTTVILACEAMTRAARANRIKSKLFRRDSQSWPNATLGAFIRA